jgi:hypothetical protein
MSMKSPIPHRPLADIHGYRGVEYAVWELSPGDWQWTYYPKAEVGVKAEGSAKGDREIARAACTAAIDAWLGPSKSQT